MSHAPTHSHDKLIRRILSRKENAITFLRSVLPSAVLQVLDLDRLRVVSSSFVSQAMRDRRGDLLLHVPFRRKTRGKKQPQHGMFIQILIEHQRSPDHRIPVRFLSYEVLAWESWLEEHPAQTGRTVLQLPPVLPIVIYQGERPWNVAPGVLEMTRVDDLGPAAKRLLLPYFASQRYLLYDLGRTADDELGGEGIVHVTLVAMKYIGSKQLADKLRELMDDFVRYWENHTPGGLQDFDLLLKYLLSAGEHLTVEQLHAIVEPLGEKAQEKVMTEAQRLIQQGREEGRKEGREEGRKEGLLVVARALLDDGMAPERIASLTRLSLDQILELRESAS